MYEKSTLLNRLNVNSSSGEENVEEYTTVIQKRKRDSQGRKKNRSNEDSKGKLSTSSSSHSKVALADKEEVEQHDNKLELRDVKKDAVKREDLEVTRPFILLGSSIQQKI